MSATALAVATGAAMNESTDVTTVVATATVAVAALVGVEATVGMREVAGIMTDSATMIAGVAGDMTVIGAGGDSRRIVSSPTVNISLLLAYQQQALHVHTPHPAVAVLPHATHVRHRAPANRSGVNRADHSEHSAIGVQLHVGGREADVNAEQNGMGRGDAVILFGRSRADGDGGLGTHILALGPSLRLHRAHEVVVLLLRHLRRLLREVGVLHVRWVDVQVVVHLNLARRELARRHLRGSTNIQRQYTEIDQIQHFGE